VRENVAAKKTQKAERKRKVIPKAESRARTSRRHRASCAARRRETESGGRLVERLLLPFMDLFGAATWKNVVALVAGVLLCFRTRTVSSALHVLDGATDTGFSRFHRLLAYTKWSELAASRRLLGMVIEKFGPNGDLVFGVDDTTERRKGPRIQLKGVFRDAVRSSRRRVVTVPGLRWLTVQALVNPPFSSRTWGLPIFTMLCPADPAEPARQVARKAASRVRAEAIAAAIAKGATATEAAAMVTKAARKATTKAKAEAKAKAETAALAANATSDAAGGEQEQKPRPHRTLPQRTAVVMGLVQMWLRERTIVMVGDGSFACRQLFMELAAKVVCVARCRMDVRLFDDAPPRTGKRGRPAKKGVRQVRLAERLKDKQTKWTATTVAGWSRRDGKAMEVEFITGTAMWSGKGGSVPVRWVLTRVVGMKRKPAAFLCTDLNRTADEILRWYAMRWAVEVTFQEARRHLGVETQRQWSDLAIRRTTPVLFGLFSLVVLWAANRADTTDTTTGEKAKIPVRDSAWYRKVEPTFSDCIAAIRRGIWAEERVEPILWRTDFRTWRQKARSARNPTPFDQRAAEHMARAA